MVLSKVVAAIPFQRNGFSGKVATTPYYNTQFVILYNLCAFGEVQNIIITIHETNNIEIISSSSSYSGRIRFDSCSLCPQNKIGPSISSSVILCVFVLLVYIVVLVYVIEGSKVDMVSGVIQMLICKTHKS